VNKLFQSVYYKVTMPDNRFAKRLASTYESKHACPVDLSQPAPLYLRMIHCKRLCKGVITSFSEFWPGYGWIISVFA